MTSYAPTGFSERSLSLAAKIPGKLGQLAEADLRRCYRKRCYAHFVTLLDGLTADDVVFDLGANVGQTAEVLAKTGVQVHAYEPDPETFKTLEKTCTPYPNVTLFNEAVALKGGTASFFRRNEDKLNDFQNATGNTITPMEGRPYQSEEITVPVVSFEDAMKRAETIPKIVKMDIEGAEMEILEAMHSGTLAMPFDHLFVETHEASAKDQALGDILRVWTGKLNRPNIHLYWP